MLAVVEVADLGEGGPRLGLAPEGIPQREVAAVADPLVEIGADQREDLLDRIVRRRGDGGLPDLVVLLVVVLQSLGQEGLLVAEIEDGDPLRQPGAVGRSEEHTSELQSLMRISYAVFCLKKKNKKKQK